MASLSAVDREVEIAQIPSSFPINTHEEAATKRYLRINSGDQ